MGLLVNQLRTVSATHPLPSSEMVPLLQKSTLIIVSAIGLSEHAEDAVSREILHSLLSRVHTNAVAASREKSKS